MSRPLRLEFPGALYHVTARGNVKADIYLGRRDRIVWLSILEEICTRYNFVVHSFCQMSNHYHIVLETIDGNLIQGMRQLNGRYSQYFNRRHQRVGHVFQGRYKGILIQREKYLLELARYVVLNPVRAGFVQSPEQWAWSSYPYFIGQASCPAWLDVASTLATFAVRQDAAMAAYQRFVIAGIGEQSPLLKTAHQLLLGDAEFIANARAMIASPTFRAVNKSQRRALTRSLAEYAAQYHNRDEAMARAYHSTAYTMNQIAAHFGVSDKTVSRAIKKQMPG